jgi:hypothetical protein
MKASKLSNDQLITDIINLSLEYKKRFGKSLGITGEVGEYKASQLLKLKRVPGNINKGFDAIDSKGKKVQIKTRIFSRNNERTSAFTNFGFDYAILVLLSDKYEIIEIHKAHCKYIQKKIDSQSYKRPALTIGDFKKLSKLIYK